MLPNSREAQDSMFQATYSVEAFVLSLGVSTKFGDKRRSTAPVKAQVARQ